MPSWTNLVYNGHHLAVVFIVVVSRIVSSAGFPVGIK